MTAAIVYDGDKDAGEIHFHPDNHPDNGVALKIQFQRGIVAGGDSQNGVQNEEVIALLVLRLRDLNRQLPCRENSLAITNLEQAQMWLERRTQVRTEQGVEATAAPHAE